MKHYSLSYWLERLEQSDKLLEITQLVDGRGRPLYPRLASSKLHTLLSQSCCLPWRESSGHGSYTWSTYEVPGTIHRLSSNLHI